MLSVTHRCSFGMSPPPSSVLVPKAWSGALKTGWGFGSVRPAACWASWKARLAREGLWVSSDFGGVENSMFLGRVEIYKSGGASGKSHLVLL